MKRYATRISYNGRRAHAVREPVASLPAAREVSLPVASSPRPHNPWPRLIQHDERMAGNAAMCDRCDELRTTDDGRPCCPKIKADCPDRLYRAIQDGACPLGKHK